MQIKIELPGVKLGVLSADSIQVRLVVADLAREMDEVCNSIRSRVKVEQVAELESIRGVRGMFRAWGVDPARYRPSSEALLRRVTQGKGLYRVSNVVDISNLGSIETGWPYGCYNRDAIQPPVTLRLGRAGEIYERIGREKWHLEGHPVLVDSAGPFGSPMSDSTRTMITEAARSVMVVPFAPANSSDADLQRALAKLGDRLARHASATNIQTAIIKRD